MPTIMEGFNTGIAAMNNLQRNKILAAQARYADPMEAGNLYKLQTQNKYLDPMLASELFKAKTENQYLPEKLRLANQYQGLANTGQSLQNTHLGQVNQFYPEMTRNEIEKLRTENRFAPLEMAIKTQNALRLSSRFGDAFALRQELGNMPKASRDAWIADHHDEYVNMVNTIANAAAKPQQNFLEGLAGNYFPEAKNDRAMQNQSMSNQGQGLGAPLQIPQPKPVFSSSPESLQRGKLAAEMSANNDLLTGKTRTQAAAAINLDNWLNENRKEYGQRIENLSKYAGLVGKGKKSLDALQRENPKAYQDYQWFNNTFKNQVDALLTQMEGLSVTEGQQKRLIELSSGMFNNMTTDPKSAVKQFNDFMKMTQEISKQRINTAQPLYKDTSKKAYGYEEKNEPYVKPKYSQADLNKLAQDAIAKGADPKAVEQRIKELMNG